MKPINSVQYTMGAGSKGYFLLVKVIFYLLGKVHAKPTILGVMEKSGYLTGFLVLITFFLERF